MQSWLPTAVGMIAGCLSTAAFVPQVLKIWREGDTRAISTRMYVLRDLGFVLWLAYGLALRSAPLIVFNVLSLLLGGTILVLKLRGRAREARAIHEAAREHELGSAA
jgi:MtN3 and saliva related transmembrane protein